MPDARFALRFVGRFVFAQQVSAGGGLSGFVDVLAPNMQFNRSVPADPHQFMMTAPRHHVIQPGGRPIDFVILASVPDKAQAEQAVWNLAGHNLSFSATGAFSWDDKTKLANLDALASDGLTGVARTFNRALLDPTDTSGLINGAIHLEAGRGVADQFVQHEVEFVRINGPDQPVGAKQFIADLVTVSLTLPENTKLIVTLTPRAGGAKSDIVINETGGETVVTFMNLCSRSSRDVDEEFAGFYEVLTGPPAVRTRLVPKVIDPLIGIDDCYPSTYAEYEA